MPGTMKWLAGAVLLVVLAAGVFFYAAFSGGIQEYTAEMEDTVSAALAEDWPDERLRRQLRDRAARHGLEISAESIRIDRPEPGQRRARVLVRQPVQVLGQTIHLQMNLECTRP